MLYYLCILLVFFNNYLASIEQVFLIHCPKNAGCKQIHKTVGSIMLNGFS